MTRTRGAWLLVLPLAGIGWWTQPLSPARAIRHADALRALDVAQDRARTGMHGNTPSSPRHHALDPEGE